MWQKMKNEQMNIARIEENERCDEGD